MANLRLINSLANTNNKKCIVCSKCKVTRTSFKRLQRSLNLIHLIHTNICKIIDTLFKGGKRYFITFINNASKYTYVYPLRTKDEVFEKFKSYKVEVENLLNLKIKVLRSDRGSEFMDS